MEMTHRTAHQASPGSAAMADETMTLTDLIDRTAEMTDADEPWEAPWADGHDAVVVWDDGENVACVLESGELAIWVNKDRSWTSADNWQDVPGEPDDLRETVEAIRRSQPGDVWVVHQDTIWEPEVLRRELVEGHGWSTGDAEELVAGLQRFTVTEAATQADPA